MILETTLATAALAKSAAAVNSEKAILGAAEPSQIQQSQPILPCFDGNDGQTDGSTWPPTSGG